ncbi:type I polyketide synthase [Nocardia altamirensis]|uniref:type I polyketide synthase n=1 Tax=Nocardia altamirensis TaxID=472158 RepID=UPI00083FFFA4|nr:type I polyketide synthase [Nocardia altamirensis]
MTATGVAIVGIGCRVPGAVGAEEFWRMLLAGRDATGPPPAGRLGRHGGYLNDIESFDNDWFAIADREAALLDPQQRLAMEVAVEALDDAGIGYRTKGSEAAVIFGASGYDHGVAVLSRSGFDATYAVAGAALSIIANRLSYVLDVHGPSLVLDSACSSSLAAVDLAVRLLTDHTVPFAIVGGVNLTLLPNPSNYLAESGFLAPDGRATPFDADADGYTRADGCAVVILQRTEDAVREGNRIYAEIAGSAVGSDGRTNGLSAPNGRAQQEVVRAAWARAELAPGDAGYFECHASSTSLGDAVEIEALSAVVAQGDSIPDTPIRIGSVKANIGHTEAAAGIIGLIKAALSVYHGTIAPTIGLRTENPLLKLAERGLCVPTSPVDWRAVPIGERHAGVSAFGFGGTNAHVVLRGAATTPTAPGADPPTLIPVTGRDTAELRARALRYADRLALDDEPLREFAAAAARLLPEQHRSAVLARDRGEAVARLRALGNGATDAVIGPASMRRHGGLLFVFSGQGGQHLAMGRALAARHRAFACAVAEAADAIVAAGGPRVWTPRHGFALGAPSNGNGTHVTELVQPALFACQVALAELLAAWGIRPDAVAGHGLGEIAAATACGALSLSDGALIAVQRGKALAGVAGDDAMALLTAAPYEAAKLVEPMRAQVRIAAVNGPRSVVVSGAARYVDTLVRRANRRNMIAERITVDCTAPAAVLPEFVDALAELTPLPPRVPMYSTARRGEALTTAVLDGAYWAENASGTVELAAALEHAVADGISTVLEVGPHPVLLPALREYPEFRDAAHPVATRADEAGDFLSCLAELHLEGRAVDWSAQGPFTVVPPRGWRSRRFPLITTAAARDAGEYTLPPEDLTDHVVHGVPTVPAVFWLRRLLHLASAEAVTMLADFVVRAQLELAALPEVTYRRHDDGSLRAEVTDAGALASARQVGDPTPADIVAWMRVVDANRAGRHQMRAVQPATFYDDLRGLRLEYGPGFRVLRGIAVGPERAVGTFDVAELRSAATLDGCLQLLAATGHDGMPAGLVPLTVGIESAWLSAEPHRTVLEAHAFLRTRTGTELIGDVIGTDQHGVPCLAMSGVHIRFAQPGAHNPIGTAPERAAAERAAPFRQETWEPCGIEALRLANSDPVAERALVVGGSGLALRLATALDDALPTERVTRELDAASGIVTAVLTRRPGHARTAVVLCWSAERSAAAKVSDAADGLATVLGRVLDLLQRVDADDGAATVTVVLPLPAPSAATQAIAGLVRSLQLESRRPVRLVWTDADPRNVASLCRLIAGDPARLPDEMRLSAGQLAVRRFTAARYGPAKAVPIDVHGTYVVTGGLGILGSVAVRWLLDAGARDVVVLTRAPRPVPALLDGLEDRIVVVRCDAADHGDLANALNDVRACGSTIRGVVHAAGSTADADFPAVSTEQLVTMFAPKVTAAANLIELTAADPTDFILLCSAATGALGGSGQAASAAANAAMDALARAYPERGVRSVGWGRWTTVPDTDSAPRPLDAFDTGHGAALLGQALRYDQPYLLAVPDAAPGNARRPDPVSPRWNSNGIGRPPARHSSAADPVPAGQIGEAL